MRDLKMKKLKSYSTCLTHEIVVLLSYRNQSIDFLCKSIGWFLYKGNTGTGWVNNLEIFFNFCGQK